MNKKRFSEEQIIGLLREVDAGLSVKALFRTYGFSETSYDAWNANQPSMIRPITLRIVNTIRSLQALPVGASSIALVTQ